MDVADLLVCFIVYIDAGELGRAPLTLLVRGSTGCRCCSCLSRRRAGHRRGGQEGYCKIFVNHDVSPMFLGKQYCGGSGSSGGTLISVVLAVAIGLADRQRQRPRILAA